MVTLTGKANVIHDFQMPPSLSPFLQCLREQLFLGTHTAPGGEAVSTGQVPATTKTEPALRLWQATLTGASSVLPSRWSYIFTHSASEGAWAALKK